MKDGTGFEQCYHAQAAVRQIEQSPAGTATGTMVLAALDGNGHHRSVSDLEAKADPPAPEPGASVNETMRHRLQTAAGKEPLRPGERPVRGHPGAFTRDGALQSRAPRGFGSPSGQAVPSPTSRPSVFHQH